ncbi:MAG: PAS domain-containing protein [Gammaproteobacteria bacterium]|nr:PAS domain-containing protein [Gammaproteobacteria bacterium]
MTDSPRISQQVDIMKYLIDKHAVIGVFDQACQFSDVNQKLTDISGFNLDTLLCAPCPAFDTEPSASTTLSLKQVIEDLKSQALWHGQIQGKTADNQPFWLSATVTASIGNICKADEYIIIASDITETIRHEHFIQLQSSALEAIADGVVISDAKGHIQWINPAFSRTTGYAPSEVLGKYTNILKSGKQDASYYKDLWNTIVRGKVWHGELWNRKKDGSLYLEDQSITPVKDEQGNISHFIAVKRDITDQYDLRYKLMYAQKMEAMTQLTGGISHNFNNKLATIMGYTELAIEAIAKYKDNELDDYLNEIITAGRSAHKLVEQMLSFSCEDFTEIQPLDILPVIKETLKILDSTLPSSITVSTAFTDNLPQIKSDPAHIHQMIMTLCINARDAMENNGELHIGVSHTQITDGTCHSCHDSFDGDYVELTVKDSGHGISTKNLENIFLPFFTTREMANGTGMGLSVLHGILHEQNGHIIVESTLNKGTTFHLLFPAHRGNTRADITDNKNELQIPATPVLETVTTEPELHKDRILIVDDEKSFANMLNDMFNFSGYITEVHNDSQEALKKFKTTPDQYDLVITDQTMPQLSGVELAKSIHSISPHIPIILMSGMGESDRTHHDGAISEYLSKPFKLTEAIKTVEALLKKD